MQARDFLRLAISLAAGATEAEWRTAVSRAYYAAFHGARDLLDDCGFAVPRGEQAHGFLHLRLSNAGVAVVQQAGKDLNGLRRSRNWADYDLKQSFAKALAAVQVALAEEVIRALETAMVQPSKLQITDAMKIYERDVLKT